MEMVVCKKVRYPITAKGKVDTSYDPKTIRKRMVVQRQFVENWNKDNAKLTGVKYIIDEKATKEYYSKSEADNKARKERKEMEQTIAAAKIGELATKTAATLLNAQAPPTPKEEKPKKPETPPKQEAPKNPGTSPKPEEPKKPASQGSKTTPKTGSQTAAKNQAAQNKK